MSKRRLTINLKRKYAMHVTRVSLGKKKLVYVILAERPLKYPWGRSRVAYIGTTKTGMSRFAQSAAAKAEEVLNLRAIRQMDVRVITCTSRPNVRSWVKLERALLLTFRHKYGAIPKCNSMGRSFRRADELRYFSQRRLEAVLEQLQ